MLDGIIENLKKGNTGTIFFDYIQSGITQDPEALIREIYDQIIADYPFEFKNMAAVLGMQTVLMIRDYVENESFMTERFPTNHYPIYK